MSMDWVIVQVVIGLSFLFFLLSIIASAVSEAIAGAWKLRAKMLEKGIINLLTGSTKTTGGELQIVRDLYEHTLVSGYAKEGSKPSYLASRSFRNALFTVTKLLEPTAESASGVDSAARLMEIEAKINELPNEHLRRSLLTLWQAAEHNATDFRAGVERWFDRSMERVSGWYKRKAQLMLFIIGLLVAVLANASALNAANRLWKDDGLRQGLIAQVENQPEDSTGSQALERLDGLGFPIGWEEANRPDDATEWVLTAAGWLITAIAVSFGAAFWFDLLGKVSNLRNAGRKPDTVLGDGASPPHPSSVAPTPAPTPLQPSAAAPTAAGPVP
jgi:hypothetical protein